MVGFDIFFILIEAFFSCPGPSLGNRLHSIRMTRNSSGDETANVNFLYDDIVHVLQSMLLVEMFVMN